MLELLPQIIWFALLSSAIYALVAIGLSLIFGILEFINFAHGDMAMIGAYLFFTFLILLKLPTWLSFILVILTAAIIGIAIEKLTFKPVRRYNDFIPMIISIGLGGFIQALIILIFGASVKSYRQTAAQGTNTYELLNGNLIVTDTQLLIIATTIILLIGLYLFLKYAKTGKAIRAVADNKEIASILGISIDKTLSIIFAIGTALAAVAGLLVAAEQNLNPTMGLSLAVKAFAAIVLGGVGNLAGAVIGALIVGFSENLIVGLTSIPASYKDAIVFLIFIIAVFLKPNGILGAKLEEEARK